MNKPQYMNAKQIYEAYGIARVVLTRLVDAGKLRCQVIEDEFATLKLYSVEDLEKIVNGGQSNG